MTTAALPGKADRRVNKSNTTRPGLPPSENHTIFCVYREPGKAVGANSGRGEMSPTQASNLAVGVTGEAPGKFPSDNRRPSPQPPGSAQSNMSKTQECYKSGVAEKLDTADKT